MLNFIIIMFFTCLPCRYLGGIKDELVHESLKQILAGIATLKAGKIGVIINTFLTNASNWNWIITEN